MTKYRRTITLWVLVAMFAAAGFAASTVNVSPANAAAALMATVGMKSGNAPKPTCPAPFVFSGKKASCVPCPQGSQFDKASSSCKAAPTAVQKCTTTTDAKGTKTTICVSGAQATVAGKKASASALVSGSITILADSTVKGGVKTVQIHSSMCHFVRNFKNSGKDANGHLHFFVDHNGTLCPSKASPTGWVKVSGGMTGRHCMNPAAEMGSKFKVIKGTILLVKSFANINVPIRASVSVLVQDSCGHAAASVLANASISLSAYARAKGNVSISIFGKTVFSLKESVAASIVCGPTQTVTQPGTTTTLPGTTTTVPVTTTTPPTTTTVPVPSPTIRVQQIQELYPNETRPLCANVKNVPSGGGTVDFTVQDGAAPKGTVSPASQPVSSGDSQVCVTYQAPASTGTNQYFATLKVGGKQVDQDSLWVEIIAQPSNP
jgi:hypothetical protein